jgi:hypothetical protein
MPIRGLLIVVALSFLAAHAPAAEYFVRPQGSDQASGASVEASFATVQRGVDALQPGDTLTILPGEYFGPVRRAGLGSDAAVTRIRAQIPGTVILRGDRPVPAFVALPEANFVYVAQVGSGLDVHAVNELDTLTNFESMPNAQELAFAPGRFHYDHEAGKLYISTSDYQPPASHRYSVSVVPTHGMHFMDPRRLVIEGLTVTGFIAAREAPRADMTLSATWGIFLARAKDCVVRDCHVYLNGQGIGMHSQLTRNNELGGNLIERCVAWANSSPFTGGDTGGITILESTRDVIRDCVAFRNSGYGINFYLGAKASELPENRSSLLDNLAWGNGPADLKVKTGYEHIHLTQGNVVGKVSVANGSVNNLFLNNAARSPSVSNINLADETGVDPDRQFADPQNFDYRLQAGSRFHNDGPEGKHRGPAPVSGNVFFVSPKGDDAADGLSVQHAWRTLGHAAAALKPGATLYLMPGEHQGDLTLTVQGEPDQPIRIRGRGVAAVAVAGAWRFQDSRHVIVERLAFHQPVRVQQGSQITLTQSRFAKGVEANGVKAMDLRHNEFADVARAALTLVGCTDVTVTGNRFDNRAGSALAIDDLHALRFADYNGYARTDAAWVVQGQPASTQPVSSPSGPQGWPVGVYRMEAPASPIRLAQLPRVHRVGATTADIEWITSHPAACEIAWGDTTACENRATFDVDHFGTLGLTGLKPGATYHFRIVALRVPKDLEGKISGTESALNGPAITFTTLAAAPPPRTLYVSPQGNDQHSGSSLAQAWRTLGHAASQVQAGDTVLVGQGVYAERVRIRATGAPEAPITFAALPGQKAQLSGADKQLNHGFVVRGKSHLRFDGLYFADFSYLPLQGWPLALSGEFSLYRTRDIQITRCFSDGRNGYTARFVTALDAADLTLRNSVTTNKMSGALLLEHCPGLLVEHCVIARPMISTFVLRNTSSEPALVRNNVLTDGFKKKADVNASILHADLETGGIRVVNNGFFLRSFGPDKRHLVGEQTIEQLGGMVIDPLFANPKFAGEPTPTKAVDEMSGLDQMMWRDVPLDFADFFATNPAYVERGIGLQPQAFAPRPATPQ